MEIVKAILGLLVETFKAWNRDRAARWAASLAFYMLFSMAPLLVLSVAVMGLVIEDEERAEAEISQQAGLVAGRVGRQAVEFVFENVDASQESPVAAAVSAVTLVFGAVAIFVALQDALNVIWNVPPDPDVRLLEVLKKRLLSFVVIIFLGLLLLVAAIVDTIQALVNTFLSGFGQSPAPALQVIDFVISFVLVTLAVALVFKVLPDVEVAWNDVWIGAVVTTLLFAIGRLLIRLYFQAVPVNSAYGAAAGPFIAFLIWVYFSAQIIFFGAELTQVYANKYGSRLVPLSTLRREKAEQREAEKVFER